MNVEVSHSVYRKSSGPPLLRGRRTLIVIGTFGLFLLFELFYSAPTQALERLSFSHFKSRAAPALRPVSQPLRHPNMLASHTPQGQWPLSMEGSKLADHPIPALMREAKRKWDKKLNSQSTTLRQAKAVYVKKYGRQPPRGFDTWHDKVSSHGHVLMDQYDLLMEKISLYSHLPPHEIRRRTWELGTRGTFTLVHVINGKVSVTLATWGKHVGKKKQTMRAEGFAMLIQPIAELLPDMTFPINELPDPRILPPWESIHNKSKRDKASLHFPSQKYNGSETLWRDYTRTCPPHSAARYQQDDYHFVSRQRESHFRKEAVALTHEDLCSNDPSLHTLHSQFYEDYRAVSGLFPAFSCATADGFGDISFPSRYYFNWLGDRYQLRPGASKDFRERYDQIYWRGTALPGWDTPALHQPDFPRRRFLEMASNATSLKREVDIGVPNDDSGRLEFTKHDSTKLNTDIMDVGFSPLQTEQCGPPASCVSLHESGQYPYLMNETLSRVLKYKFLIDLDGLSYSARFHALLAGGGAVLKSTFYKEFYTEWLEPWYHYIPLSLTYDETYDIFAYFLGLDPGAPKSAAAVEREEQLEQIAQHGVEWKRDFGDLLDMNAYTHRMALEWARLYRGERWQAKSPDEDFDALYRKYVKKPPPKGRAS